MSPYEVIAGWSAEAWPLLANHLWQATLFSLLALAAAASLGRAPARARYLVWLVALIKFALPSVFLFFLAAQAGVDLPSLSSWGTQPSPSAQAVSPLLSPVTRSYVVLRTAEDPSQGAGASGVAFTETTLAGGGRLNGIVACLWLAGCAVLAVSWLSKRRGLSVSVKSGRELVVGREAEVLRSAVGRFGLRRQVRLVSTPAVSEPGVWGVWRPVVVLPDGVADRLDDDELGAVFMHELSHIERWDNLAGNLQRALCCLFWFHPVIWMINRRMLAEREQACDDRVVGLVGAPEVYVNGIAKVCRYCLGWETAGLAKATGSDLKKRIERIVSRRAGHRMSAPQAAAVAALSAGALALSLASGEPRIARHAPLRVEGAATADPRFEVVTPRTPQEPEAADGQLLARPSGPQYWQENGGPPPQKGMTSRAARPDKTAASPEKPSATAEAVGIHGAASNADAPPPDSQITRSAQPRQPTQPPQTSAGDVRAAVVNASDVSYGDLRKFIGRYEVDPSKAENFVLDITLEGGGLWLKPSHSPKRRLIRQTETDFSDSYSDYNLTCILDGRDRVVGLRLNSWGRDVTARKLSLPPPSLRGNVTFKLRGFPDARVVAVAGDFNNWNQSQFLFAKEGDDWVCRVNIPAGTHQYKFIVDGNWLTDPNNPNVVHDGRGFENSLLRAE